MNPHAAARMALIAHIAGRPKPDWDAAVKAVLAAFREPTAGMVDAYCRALRGQTADERMRMSLLSSADAHRIKCIIRWRAMIDEAGNGPGQSKEK